MVQCIWELETFWNRWKAEYKDQHTGSEAMEGDTQIMESLCELQRIWTLLGRAPDATEDV